MPGLSRRSKSQGELREWGGRAWQQQWEEHPWGGSRPREDELWDDGGQWEEGGRWEVGGGRGQWEPARRIDPPIRNTGFAHVVREAVRKERGAGHKMVDPPNQDTNCVISCLTSSPLKH